MKHNQNLQIQYLIIQDYDWSTCRRIKYRIKNHQLPWWQRNFIFNPWKPLFYTDVSGHTHNLFSKWQYQNELKPRKTLKDIYGYLNEQVRLRELYKDDEW